MEPKIVTLRRHTNSQNKVFLCPEMSTMVEDGEMITIQYGLEKTQAKVVHVNKSDLIALSSNIWNQLSIPFAHKIHASISDQNLLIGPLVGMMTTGVRNHPTQPVGHRTGFYQRYILTQKDVPASFFVFTPADIVGSKRVYGYFLRTENSRLVWRKCLVPLPSVIYNRVFRRGEKMRFVTRGRSVLEKAGCKIFNPYTFNKWKIHQLIHQRKDIQDYIPESVINPNLKTLSSMLRRHKMIYLKPAEGFLGLGIIQIISQPRGVLCRFNHQGRNHLRLYPNLPTLIKGIFKNKSLRRYIAQQGIHLIQFNGRTIDFRVHANKDRYGQWKMTGVAAKMSGRGSVTTHMRTGGNVLSFGKVVRSFFPANQQKKVHEKLRQAVIALATAIEESLPDYVGDIGFDIGIDHTGNPWMFEANSQPGRHVFAHPSMKESEKLTRKGILDYALFLSGFTSKEVTKT